MRGSEQPQLRPHTSHAGLAVTLVTWPVTPASCLSGSGPVRAGLQQVVSWCRLAAPSSLFFCPGSSGGQHLVPRGFTGKVTRVSVPQLEGELWEKFLGRLPWFCETGLSRDLVPRVASVSLWEGYIRRSISGSYLGSGLRVNPLRRKF